MSLFASFRWSGRIGGGRGRDGVPHPRPGQHQGLRSWGGQPQHCLHRRRAPGTRNNVGFACKVIYRLNISFICCWPSPAVAFLCPIGSWTLSSTVVVFPWELNIVPNCCCVPLGAEHCPQLLCSLGSWTLAPTVVFPWELTIVLNCPLASWLNKKSCTHCSSGYSP